jgi:hypothetical protein
MTESQQLALKIDEFVENHCKALLPDTKYGFSEGVYWCVGQLMSRNDLTQGEALEMLGITKQEEGNLSSHIT